MLRKRALNGLVLFIILLSATVCVFTGCERKMLDNIFRSGDLGFIDTTWEITSINDQPFEPPFAQDAEPEFPTTFAITSNSWVFHASGNLTGELAFTVSEQYPGDPPTSMTQVITYTVTGQYTAGETTLTIETQNVEVDVAVTLEPREVWEQQIAGITVEQLQADLAAETKMGFTQDESTFPFTVGVDYTHQTEQNTLTLSVPGEKILLKKKMME